MAMTHADLVALLERVLLAYMDGELRTEIDAALVCCCLHPEDNVRCDICRGKGGYMVCATCHPDSVDDHL